MKTNGGRSHTFPASVATVCLAGMAAATTDDDLPPLPDCVLIATGGTIAMRMDPVKKALVPALSVDDLAACVPEISSVAQISVENLFNIPSEQMTPDHWVAIQKAVDAALAKDKVSGVVISHGTDSIEETAYFLDLTIASDKPVVLTGAMRGASDRDADGPRNILDAVRLSVDPQARGKGVMVALNGKINAARDVTKTHSSDVGAFKSGDAGFLGGIDGDTIFFSRSPLRRQTVPLRHDILPRVDIVPMYAGADGALVRAAMNAGAKGIVIQALGMGNVNASMYEAIVDAINHGVVVDISTRVHDGRVFPEYGMAGGGKSLKDAGALFADNLPPQKARILLMLALQNTIKPADIQSLFDK